MAKNQHLIKMTASSDAPKVIVVTNSITDSEYPMVFLSEDHAIQYAREWHWAAEMDDNANLPEAKIERFEHYTKVTIEDVEYLMQKAPLR